MSDDLLTAWDVGFARWSAANEAVKTIPADVSDDDAEPLIDEDYDAWTALLATPAPDWVGVAWKVRQLLETPPRAESTPSWSTALVAPLLTDVDRLLPHPDEENGTTREVHSHAAPDQHKSEEIIVADTANSTGASKPEGVSTAPPSPIRQLATMREVAERRSEECSGADMVDVTAADRHWDRQYQALGLAIMAEAPLSVADAFSVLHCVVEMREIMGEISTTGFANLVNPLDCTELTSVAISNCLPILAAAVAQGDLTPGQHRSAALAAKRAAIRENGNG